MPLYTDYHMAKEKAVMGRLNLPLDDQVKEKVEDYTEIDTWIKEAREEKSS